MERLVSLFHGLHYLNALGTAVGILVTGFMLASGDIPRVFSSGSAPYVIGLIAALQAGDFFRQRFFLHPSEHGLHWRAALLRYAKWPIVLLALKDALRPRRVDYALTLKTPQPARRSMLVVPHALTVFFLGGAAALGAVVNHVDSRPLWSTVALVIAFSLIAMATSLAGEPPPYDPALRSDERAPRSSVSTSPKTDSTATRRGGVSSRPVLRRMLPPH
jgi:cellulose synthase (UDP-forming)